MVWNVFQQTHLRIILDEATPNIDLADRISSSLNFCSNLKQNLDSTSLHSLKKLSDFSFKLIYFFFLASWFNLWTGMERPKYYKEAWYFQPSQNHKALEIQLEKTP